MSTFHFSPRTNLAHLINWREWGEKAFQEAQSEDKLILLSIGAVWCHWCHVMDEEAYSDEENIKLINERFIPVRVDNDRQPDVNRRYNMGGWPTTAILTPEGELLQGGTYIPTEPLNQFLRDVDKMYHENTEEVKEKLTELYERQRNQVNRIEERDLKDEMIQEVRTMILAEYDEEYGGFGQEPKFPHIEALDFLLDEYHRTKDESIATVLHTTLANIAGGGMFDREMGGFFRYSTTRDWSIPHFEKMLEDNVKLLSVYLKAFQIFNENGYKDTVLDVIMYLKEWLIDEERGLFYGSQDADEEYYEMTRGEREKVKAPFIDQTIYTSWNGMAISAFLKAFAVLDAIDCRDIALKGIDFLMENCFNPAEGMYHYYHDGTAHNTGLLEDQLAMINALLDAYEITHQKRYLDKACRLADLILERFYDEKDGGFYVDLPTSEALKRTSLEEKPLTINSCMAEVYFRLEVITENTRYGEVVKRTLGMCANLYSRYGLFAATFGRALSGFIHGYTHITIVGDPDDGEIKKLYQESLKVYSPHKVVEELDPIQDEKRIEKLGYNPEEHQAYICKGKTCYPPIKDAEEISRVLAEV
ncbi:MAG: thioredoxin domain-containing protein [Halanaerobiales bacterium]|nr:thioredoxin domain-containing protein [Halanaerobiales bacterium]